jgi:hypothetical protein
MKTPARDKIRRYRNRSPYGWWIGSYIEQAIWDDDLTPAPNKRCLAWENTIIFKASDREAAYKKVIQLTKVRPTFTSEDGKRKGHWEFLGLTDLLPIHEQIEDGAEILWKEHRNKTVQNVRSRVKKKGELKVFQDN